MKEVNALFLSHEAKAGAVFSSQSVSFYEVAAASA